MNAAVIASPGELPRYASFEQPIAGDGEAIVSVSVAAVSQLDRSRAAGTHYSSQASGPFVPGMDGVGRLEDGRRVYFFSPRAPFGSMADTAPVRLTLTTAVPDDVDDVTAAAVANPGMSSWAALTRRAPISRGDTVVVNGATGTSGRLAVQIARHLGAGRIVATSRDPGRLGQLRALGADVVLPLIDGSDAQVTAFHQALDPAAATIVLDYLWGASAEQWLAAAARKAPGRQAQRLRFVQIGSMAAATVAMPAAVLRSADVELLGSGLGSLTLDSLVEVIGEVLTAVRPAGLSIATDVYPLQEVHERWPQDSAGRRLVFATKR